MSGVLTFLFADVRGYTRFTAEHGDEAAARLAARFAAIAREVMAASGGEVYELVGDQAVAVFTSSRQAMRAAVALQQRMAEERTADPSFPVTIGIGRIAPDGKDAPGKTGEADGAAEDSGGGGRRHGPFRSHGADASTAAVHTVGRR